MSNSVARILLSPANEYICLYAVASSLITLHTQIPEILMVFTSSAYTALPCFQYKMIHCS